jgi:hypothetical protein
MKTSSKNMSPNQAPTIPTPNLPADYRCFQSGSPSFTLARVLREFRKLGLISNKNAAIYAPTGMDLWLYNTMYKHCFPEPFLHDHCAGIIGDANLTPGILNLFSQHEDPIFCILFVNTCSEQPSTLAETIIFYDSSDPNHSVLATKSSQLIQSLQADLPRSRHSLWSRILVWVDKNARFSNIVGCTQMKHVHAMVSTLRDRF